MKKRNLLSLLAITLFGQVFYSCNTARHYEFSNRSEAYLSEKALVKATPAANSEAEITQPKAELNAEKPGMQITASSSVELIPNAAKPTVDLNEKPAFQFTEAISDKSVAANLKLDRSQKKELKTAFKQLKKQNFLSNETAAKPTVDVLELILAIFIPPLGVLLHDDGISVRFWISLLLTILFFFPGMIYALLVVTDTI